MKPERTPLSRKPAPRIGRRAFALAVLVHLLLLSILLYGLHRQRSTPSGPQPAGAQAELWTAPPDNPVIAQPAHKPPVLPTASPPTASLPTASLTDAPTPSAPPQPADIPVHTEKKQAEKQQQHKTPPPAAQQRIEHSPSAASKQHNVQQAEQQRLLQQKKQTQAEQAKAQEKKRAQALVEQQRAARLLALRQLASENTTNTTTQGKSATGTQTGAGDNSVSRYADQVQQRVKPNIIFDATTLTGNPKTVVSVQCAADGAILAVRIVQSSGHPGWDEAVVRAVRKSDPLPRDTNGRAPAHFTITFQPKA
jgi:colicin import membrane protein